MWVTYSAGCSLIVLQNQWNNEVQFCSMKFWHLPAALLGCPRRPPRTRANTRGRGGSSTPTSSLFFPRADKLGCSCIPTGPGPVLSQGLWVLEPWAALCGIPTSSLWGPSKVGTCSSSPSEWQGHGKQKCSKSEGVK